MGLTSPQAPESELALQLIVDQQAYAIQTLHEAFAAERMAWSLEKNRLYQRIASLEQLLKTSDHYSPAKSPVLLPMGSASIASPQSRGLRETYRLPIIAEDENVSPLSQRRGVAPQSLDLPGRPAIPPITRERSDRSHRGSSVSFDGEIKVDEIPISPPSTAMPLSPVPPGNRAMAGHTPLRAIRPPTPPPHNMATDGIEDTPTRTNTHMNGFLTRVNDEDEDVALKGPLNMPELPNQPDETNFTLEALSKRLEQIEQHPEQGRPMVFAEPSPGLASPADPLAEAGELIDDRTISSSAAPCPIRDGVHSQSDISSNALSPSTVRSPNGAPLSQQQSHDQQVHQEFETGGIKLKKKPSTNFGAPFGQLGGFGGLRRLS
ncbi:hypothetical protein LTR36_001767 [Oleoguttula mirabilis]|uniref:Uncharacterized protein n=1 Tax=Oleoguttula mirabilis TaxID=1507867 RepID=A0AAV9JMH6_9PEZI|nr:hypothetical protein LTR36_001767 [Oleoguttula mirabilis]